MENDSGWKKRKKLFGKIGINVFLFASARPNLFLILIIQQERQKRKKNIFNRLQKK